MTARRPRAECGYNMVAMLVILTVMNIAVAMALPMWSTVMQRDREEELIFRGLQYAEAIRVFQARHNRLPTRLEELIELEPRCLRQLWTDPMVMGADEGDGFEIGSAPKWGLIHGQMAQAGGEDGEGGRRRGRDQGRAVEEVPQGRKTGRGGTGLEAVEGEEVSVGPIVGVHSLVEEEGIKVFLGGSEYTEWRFTMDILPMPAVNPGTLAVPRANAKFVGRPFPDGLAPEQGTAPTPGAGAAGGRPGGRQGGRGAAGGGTSRDR